MYDELPRTSWIFKYSAQNTVVVSRTFFTQEVNEAFDELEEGNEEALKTEYERQVCWSCLREVVTWCGSIGQHAQACISYMLLVLCVLSVTVGS
jgi:hypothetical protein